MTMRAILPRHPERSFGFAKRSRRTSNYLRAEAENDAQLPPIYSGRGSARPGAQERLAPPPLLRSQALLRDHEALPRPDSELISQSLRLRSAQDDSEGGRA